MKQRIKLQNSLDLEWDDNLDKDIAFSFGKGFKDDYLNWEKN